MMQDACYRMQGDNSTDEHGWSRRDNYSSEFVTKNDKDSDLAFLCDSVVNYFVLSF